MAHIMSKHTLRELDIDSTSQWENTGSIICVASALLYFPNVNPNDVLYELLFTTQRATKQVIKL